MTVAPNNKRAFIFVGLGNPGLKYSLTRHNIGFMVIQSLADEEGIVLKQESRFQAHVGKGIVLNEEVHLILPQTYMNESGTALRRYLDFFKLSFKDVVVVADDVALDFGQMRIRAQGSSGGHNGLRNIERHLGTRNYYRLRMGVGAPPRQGEDALADFVLAPFTKKEQEELPLFIDKGVKALRKLLTAGFERVMNDVNTKILKESPNDGAGVKE